MDDETPKSESPTPDAAVPGGPVRRPRRRRRRKHLPIGAAPGAVQVDPEALPSSVAVTAFGREQLVEQVSCSMTQLAQLRGAHPVLWVHVNGLADAALVQRLGEHFGVHRLAIADVINVHQRAKAEDYGTHEFVVARVVDPAPDRDTEQFAMFVGKGFVLSFLERESGTFDLVKKRMRDASGQIRQRGADYLAYALLDAVVDTFFPVLERVSDRLQTIEDELLDDGRSESVLRDLHDCRRELQVMRRALWPLRDASSSLLRGETTHFGAEVRPYLRDLHDHVVQQLDILENQRELVSSLLELHMSMVNNRLNEVMKLLTVTATIFIPLTFVVGVYGMNFEWMPELRVWWGYPATMGVMVAIAGGMLFWFRRRGWL